MSTLNEISLFALYPNLSEYFETSDGQQFFKEDPAKVHGRTLKDKSVKTVERPAESDEPVDLKGTEGEIESPEPAKDLIAKVPSMDLETAQKALENENELEFPRKTVQAALNKKISELLGADEGTELDDNRNENLNGTDSEKED